MSNDKNYDEVKNEVVISVDDCKNLYSYGKHFGVEIPTELEAAAEKFIAEQTFENQQEFKLELCNWMLTSEHESFQDKLWEEPRTIAKEALYDLKFDKDLKEALTEETED